MQDQHKSTGRGGRPAKEEHQKASVKINCWLTPGESKQLISHYDRVKAGRKLAFSTFIRQTLLQKSGPQIARPQQLLLTILIQLQQQNQRLEQLKSLLGGCDSPLKDETIHNRIDSELDDIKGTMRQLTAWLYEA